MIQLAIECSGTHGSLAISRHNQLIRYEPLAKNQSSVQSLSLGISRILDAVGSKPQFLSVTNGPGSFTGLRVGIATAKMLAWAWEIPVVPVDTLEVIARRIGERYGELHLDSLENSSSPPLIFVPVINAFRGQVFSAAWQSGANGSILRLVDPQVVDAKQWLERPLESLGLGSEAQKSSPDRVSSHFSQGSIIIAGPATELYRPSQDLTSTTSVQVLDGLQPDAKAVAQIGWQLFNQGLHVSPEKLKANYIRKSAAEDKLLKKGLASNSK